MEGCQRAHSVKDIRSWNQKENWEGRDIWFVECDECGARTAEYLEAEEAVDAWKRRA